jgi:hypothetical protein
MSSPHYFNSHDYAKIEKAGSKVANSGFVNDKGQTVEYLNVGMDDPYGSKMAVITNADGSWITRAVPFWEITGSYYNELLYFSGLVAFDTYSALESMTSLRNISNDMSLPLSFSERTEIPILSLTSPFRTANYSLYKESTVGRSPANDQSTNGRRSFRIRPRLGNNSASINFNTQSIQFSRGPLSVGLSNSSGLTSEIKLVFGNHEYGISVDYLPSRKAVMVFGIGVALPTAVLPIIFAL